MTALADLSPFLLGIEGKRPTRRTVDLLRDTHAAGVLLLARNIETPAQTRALLLGLQDRLGRPLLSTIDHEGGWVLRFKAGLTAFPGNGALGRAGDPRFARQAGELMGRELRALGIAVNFAPVLDVVGETYNPGIGIRAFGRTPGLVSKLGAAFIRGHQRSGTAACAKHFPGKGAAKVDSHVSLPVIRLSRRELSRGHLAPFRAAVKAGVDCVMTSHCVLPALEPRRVPATFSRRVVDLLRRMGYDGVVVTDDLCMGAVTGRWMVPEASLASLEAGHDLIIIAHGESLARDAYALFASAVEAGVLDPARRSASRERVARLMRRRALKPSGPLPRPQKGLPLSIARAAVEVIRRGEIPIPPRLGDGKKRILVLWPDLREVADRFTFEGGVEGPLRGLKRRLRRWPLKHRLLLSPVTSKSSVPGFRPEAARADIVLAFSFEALRFPGQRRMLEDLRKLPSAKTLAVLLRGPWDAKLLGPGVSALTAHGYRDCQIEAILETLR